MQEVGLLPRKSVLDNVTLIANIADQTKDEALNNALEL
jgi:osmoprotectant transport system ATP-binding protein